MNQPVERGDASGSRYLAAVIDQIMAFLFALITAKLVPDSLPMAQGLTAFAAYFGYYFLLEGAFGTTVGKWKFGLTVHDLEGRRCSWGQALVRTLLRLIEVNPLLGALPAALAIIFSRRKQRLGDMLAGTLVVDPREQRRASPALATTTCAACGEPLERSEVPCPVCGAVEANATGR